MCASHLSLPVDAGRVESLCLARFLFSIQNIPSAPLAVFKLIVKPTRLLARPKEHLACVCKQLSDKNVSSRPWRCNSILTFIMSPIFQLDNLLSKKGGEKLQIIVLDKCLQMTWKWSFEWSCCVNWTVLVSVKLKRLKNRGRWSQDSV